MIEKFGSLAFFKSLTVNIFVFETSFAPVKKDKN